MAQSVTSGALIASKPLITSGPLIIGISGKKRSGKDTLCAALLPLLSQAGLEAKRRALADSLKDEVTDALWPCYRRFGMAWGDVRGLLDDCATKEDFRPLLQVWGTDFRRTLFGGDYWLLAMSKWIKGNAGPGHAVIVPDVRFSGEADWVHAQGGVVVRVERPGLLSADQHISETALDDYTGFDAVVVNDGTREDLAEKAVLLAANLLKTAFEGVRLIC